MQHVTALLGKMNDMTKTRPAPLVLFISLTVGTLAQTDRPSPPPSEDIAQLIGVQPQIAQLQQLAASATPDRWQLLWLHQYISERVMSASLQVDATIAQIDNEIARANEVRGFLSDRRDRTVTRANLLSALIGGGLGATSSGLQLSSSLTRPAAGVGIAAGAFSSGIAIIGIHAQPGRDQPLRLQLQHARRDLRSPHAPRQPLSPKPSWTFLQPDRSHNTPSDLTRKQQILQTWVNVKRIDSLADSTKIDHVTSQPSDLYKLTIDDLEDRAAMLQDVRARISFLKRELAHPPRLPTHHPRPHTCPIPVAYETIELKEKHVRNPHPHRQHATPHLPARPRNIRRTVLPNGLLVLTESMPHVRSVSMGVWIDSGSRDESPALNGISHFVEHMVFKGTTSRSAQQFAREVDSIGGNLDAFTGKETICFNIKVLDENVAPALDLLTDLVLHPTFTPEDIAREQGVILEEIKMDEDNPDYLVHEIFTQNFWKGDALGRPILGTVKTVSSFNQQIVFDFYAGRFTPRNMVFSAAGNLDHDAFVAQVADHFSGLAATSDAPLAHVPAPATHPHITLKRKKSLEQVQLCLGVPAPPVDSPDRYAVYLLNTMLGGGMSSRLFQTIREDRASPTPSTPR